MRSLPFTNADFSNLRSEAEHPRRALSDDIKSSVRLAEHHEGAGGYSGFLGTMIQGGCCHMAESGHMRVNLWLLQTRRVRHGHLLARAVHHRTDAAVHGVLHMLIAAEQSHHECACFLNLGVEVHLQCATSSMTTAVTRMCS